MVDRARGRIVATISLLALLAACEAPARPSESGASAPKPTPTSSSPAWTPDVPQTTDQVVRTVPSDRWCRERWCTITQAWQRTDDGWRLVREFRSSISPNGWGKMRQDDLGTPEGVFEIKVTFSTSPRNPGTMPWRQRLRTSTVTEKPGPLYNTWIEEPGRTDGTRPSMRWGFVIDYNHVRMEPGVGPAPVPNAGSGIFYHTSRPGRPWEPSEGCTRIGDPAQMRWLLTWLRPDADPRVVQGRSA